MSNKVLLVEDNLIAQRIASFIIKSCGDDPVIAKNGMEAINAAKTGTFDLIILDIGLPDIDGFTIKETLAGSGISTPIVGLTAYIDVCEPDIHAKPLTRKLYQNMLCQAQDNSLTSSA